MFFIIAKSKGTIFLYLPIIPFIRNYNRINKILSSIKLLVIPKFKIIEKRKSNRKTKKHCAEKLYVRLTRKLVDSDL